MKHIRSAKLTDLNEIIAIEKACYSDPWSRILFEREFQLPQSFFYVAQRQNQLAAFVVYWLVGKECHLLNVAVLPDFQRRGIGADLMQHLERHCRQQHVDDILLEVRPSNTNARHLYSALGFTYNGVRSKYYEDGEDALLMKKNINNYE